MGYTKQDRGRFLVLHGCAAVLHLVSAILAQTLIPQKRFRGLGFGFPEVTYEPADSDDPPVISTRLLKTYDGLDITSFLVLNEYLTSFSHLVAIALIAMHGASDQDKSRDGYSRTEEYRRRWIEYSITAGLIEVAILLANGETSGIAIGLFFVLNTALQLTGFNMDNGMNKPSVRENATGRVAVNLFAGFVFLLVQVLVVYAYRANATFPASMGQPFDAVVVLYGVFYALFGVHQALVHMSRMYRTVFDADMTFVVLSITSKIVITWTLISRYRKAFIELGYAIQPRASIESSTDASASVRAWDTVEAVMIAGAVVLITAAYVAMYMMRMQPQRSRSVLSKASPSPEQQWLQVKREGGESQGANRNMSQLGFYQPVSGPSYRTPPQRAYLEFGPGVLYAGNQRMW